MYALLYSLTCKYLRKTQSIALRTMLIMSFVSITISCSVLLLGISIMQGFERTTYAHLRTTYADLTIQAPSNAILAFNAIKTILDQEFPNLIYKPITTYYSLITSKNLSAFALLTAIDPYYEHEDFSILYQPNMSVIDEDLAKELGVKTGQQIHIICAIPTDNGSIEQVHMSAWVGKIIQTRAQATHTVYCSFEYVSPWEGGAVHQVQIYVPDHQSPQNIKQKLEHRLSIPIYSWQDLYPSLVASLTLEKYVVTSILALIVILAICTIMSVVTIFITQKKRDMALLKAMGLSTQSLQLFCYIFGLSIPISASSIGLLIGALLGIVIDTYCLIPLPDSYITTHLPVDIQCKNIINIFFFVLLLSCIIIGRANRSIRTLVPAHILKIE